MHVRCVISSKRIYMREMASSARLCAIVALAGFEAGSRIRVCDTQWSAVVLCILHRDATSIGFAVGEQDRGVESLIVYHRLAWSSAARAFSMAASERAGGTDTLSARAEKHGMSYAVAAVGSVCVVLISLSHGWLRASGEQTSFAENADIPCHVLLGGTSSGGIGVTLLPSPEEECCNCQDGQARNNSNDDPCDRTSRQAIAS